MNDFVKHGQEVLKLIDGGIDPVPLYEMRDKDSDGWKVPETVYELFYDDHVYRKKPKTVKIGDQTFEIPTLIDGNEYWRFNPGAPNAPVKTTYNPADVTIKAQGESNQFVSTKKAAIDMGKAFQYWLSEGGDK